MQEKLDRTVNALKALAARAPRGPYTCVGVKQSGAHGSQVVQLMLT